MKPYRLVLAALFGAAALPAFAACTGTALTQAELQTLLTGQLVCGRPGTAYPGSASDRWQEEHVAGGALFDFKLGVGHPVDPRKNVGSWSIGQGSKTDPATITHIYAGGPAFTWVVYGPVPNVPGASVYSFCTAGGASAEHARAWVKSSGAACGSYPP